MSIPVPPTPSTPDSSDGSPLPPRWLAKLKLEVEGYDLLERIGEGGQASVYKARRQKDQKLVAIKILHAGPHATDEARARLKRETAALMAINHPNIVHALAAGRTRSGLDCLVMNFIDGRPLDDLWEDPAFAAAVLPSAVEHPAAVLRLFQRICETVQAAHVKGITHRDLSPSNILIDAKGQPHILDFGMASTAFDGIVGRDVTVTGQFIGKLKYASPEQAKGANTKGTPSGNADIRSDVYALGVMLYQLLTSGAFPYEVVGNVLEVLHNIIHSAPKRPSEVVAPAGAASGTTGVPSVSGQSAASNPTRKNPPLVNEAIEAIVLKALEKNPDQRYQSAGELAADIDRYLRGLPTSASVWATTNPIAPSPMPIAASPMPAQPAPTNTKPNSPFPRRAAYAAAAIILMSALGGIAMNAKSLALWLGMSTVVAPVLPTDLAGLSPEAAEAAMLAARDTEDSDTRLNEIAKELARVDARLSAVNRERNARATVTLSAKDYCDALAKVSSAAGRELSFEMPTQQELDDVRGSQAKTLADMSDDAQKTELASRLYAQQAGLWARVAWGTFTGRDEKSIYTNMLKYPADVSMEAQAKYQMIDAGVQVRRITQIRMHESAAELRTIAASEQPAHADIAAVLTELSQDVGEQVEKFKSAANRAGDLGKLKTDQLTLARNLADALATAREKWETLASPPDDSSRNTATKDLQTYLRQSGEAAAKFDVGLVALAQELKIDTDPSNARSPLKPKKSPKAPGNDAAADNQLAELFTVDTVWVLDDNSLASVREVNNDEVVLFVGEGKSKGRTLRLRLSGDEIILLADSGKDGYSIDKGLKVRGNVTGGKLNLRGTRTVVVAGEQREEDVVYIFVQQPATKKVVVVDKTPVTAKDGLAAWKVGSLWTNKDARTNKADIWEVTTRTKDSITITRDANRGAGTLSLTINLLAAGKVSAVSLTYSNGRLVKALSGTGTISGASLKIYVTWDVKESGAKSYKGWNESIDLVPQN